MKRSELFFSFLLVPLDFIMLVLAGLSAYHLRFAKIATDIRPVVFDFEITSYFKILLIISVLWLAVFVFSGLYRINRSRNMVREIYAVASACTVSLAWLAVLIFFRRDLFNSRFIVLAGWGFAIIYVSFGRLFIRWLQQRLFLWGVGVRKVVVVGNGKTADTLEKEFFGKKLSGYEVVKRIRDFSLETSHDLGDFLEEYQREHPAGIDEIIQADPNLSKPEILRLYDFANEYHLTFKYAADLLGIKVLRSEVNDVAGIPIVEVKRTKLEGWGRILKRLMDVIGSGIIIAILSPVYLLTAIAIKLDSHGPVFFSERDDGTPVFRIGEGGKSFRYFKFRSMIPGTDSMRYRELADRNFRTDGPMVKIKDDPRVTRVGRFIRRWSIDELPELFLVFIGRMSLVGPRPHLPEEVAKYEQHHRKTLTIKPGITGLAQISGRTDLLFEEEVKLDIYYIENWSLLFDFYILFKTPLTVISHRKAE